MNTLHDKELQETLLNTPLYSQADNARWQRKLTLWRIWAIAGWITAGVCVWLTANR